MSDTYKMKFASSLTKLSELNSSFDQGVIKVCYPGDNRNKSSISKEDLVRCSKTIKNVPVVCNYNRDEDTLGGHDMEVVKDKDGSVHIVNITDPVGVVPESANVWFENDVDEFGVEHEYMFTNVLLWKRQEAYSKIKRDGVVSHSMEIAVKDSENVNGILHIKDFEFTALTLIGIEPCYESSSLEVFSSGGFKARMEEMMNDLKEHYASIEHCGDASNDESHNGGTILNEKEIKEEVVAGEDVSQEAEVTFDHKAEAVEETKVEATAEEESNAKEDAVEEKINSEESEDVTDADCEQQFALAQNVRHELMAALRAVKHVTRYGDEYPKYAFEDFDATTCEVFYVDREDMNLYGCAYNMSGDAVTVDFDSAKRKKLCYVDFESADKAADEMAVSAFTNIATELEGKLADARASLEEANKNIATMSAENEELKAFKASKEEEKFNNDVQSVFRKFADIHETAEFEELSGNYVGLTIEQIEDKCFSIRGRHMEEKFSMSDEDQVVKIVVPSINKEDASEPYGGAFLKYSKKH